MAWDLHGTRVGPAARTALAVALRVMLTLALVAVVIVVAAAMATWWVLWALVWFCLCGRRCSTSRLGASFAWRSPPPVHRLRSGGPAGLR